VNCSGYFSLSIAGINRPPTATIVMPLPPVNVVKKAEAPRHTTARPPGIQPNHALESATRRRGMPDSASK
jgi:hypothetical protein